MAGAEGSSDIFDVLDKKLPDLVESALQESRRSSPVIMDAVNRIFECLPRWASERLERAERAVTAWDFSQTHDRPSKHARLFRDRNVAGRREFQKGDSGGCRVPSRSRARVAEISQQARSRTIGILCRRNNKVGQMMNELQRLGVPASEEGGNYLTDSAAVELILSLLHLTDHPRRFGQSLPPGSITVGKRAGVGTGGRVPSTTGTRTTRALKNPIDRDRLVVSIRRRSANWCDTCVGNCCTRGFGNTVQGWAHQLRAFCNRREARRLTQLGRTRF